MQVHLKVLVVPKGTTQGSCMQAEVAGKPKLLMFVAMEEDGVEPRSNLFSVEDTAAQANTCLSLKVSPSSSPTPGNMVVEKFLADTGANRVCPSKPSVCIYLSWSTYGYWYSRWEQVSQEGGSGKNATFHTQRLRRLRV